MSPSSPLSAGDRCRVAAPAVLSRGWESEETKQMKDQQHHSDMSKFIKAITDMMDGSARRGKKSESFSRSEFKKLIQQEFAPVKVSTWTRCWVTSGGGRGGDEGSCSTHSTSSVRDVPNCSFSQGLAVIVTTLCLVLPLGWGNTALISAWGGLMVSCPPEVLHQQVPLHRQPAGFRHRAHEQEGEGLLQNLCVLRAAPGARRGGGKEGSGREVLPDGTALP
uniref:S100/CaBP-9k-type calcium binding subdomain domain-containing protein n=1 Tax=Pavo cristatus TaxID=9049 RepID=A0A8C9FJ80_PAVCR